MVVAQELRMPLMVWLVELDKLLQAILQLRQKLNSTIIILLQVAVAVAVALSQTHKSIAVRAAAGGELDAQILRGVIPTMDQTKELLVDPQQV